MWRQFRGLTLAGAVAAMACSVLGSSLDGYADSTCASGLESCDGACVDLQTSREHCGACGSPCEQGFACVAGQCAPESCSPGLVACGSECVDPSSDDQNCGGCGTACAVGQACSGGKCVASCTAEQTNCGGACVDTKTHIGHCGGCNSPCSAGQGCVDGNCKIACPGGQLECGGLCFDLNNDNQHCGACDNPCKPGELCANGVCSLSCPPGQVACDGKCADLNSDAANCGVCGTACGNNQECSDGKCVVACKTLLNQVIADPWGYSWDGLERAASTFEAANQTCEGIGGRLPTATELYRVSATQSATVGQTIHTNMLWSLVPYSATAQVRVQLDNGLTGGTALTSALNYRCVCPPPPRNDFSGHYCNGSVGQGCVPLQSEGNRINLDAQNRAPLHKAGAIWECTFYRAHLADFPTLVEAVKQGAPNGSATWLHTADDARANYDTLIRWTGTGAGFTLPADATWSTFSTTLRPFRCAGTNYDPGVNPNTVADQFVPPQSDYKGETVDAAAADWATTHDTCFARGGHLPRASELAELIQEGLPGGSGAQIRTSDGAGRTYTSDTFYAQVLLWTGEAPRYAYSYSTQVTWSSLPLARAFRCIYYPLDTSYAGPQEADCAGGCTKLTLAGNPAPTLWLDSFDRVPASYLNAIDGCRQVGGHLASPRDLVEAVRQGLPNGSSAWLHTSDIGVGTVDTTISVYELRNHVLRWTGVDAAFTGMSSTYQSWGLVATARPYRCMWTNELR